MTSQNGVAPAASAPARTAAPALELRDVTVTYGEQVAVRGVNLSVAAGQVTALVGANGAGKTTLLKAASGLLGTRSGQVLIGGQDVTGKPANKRVRAGMCLIPEGRGIFPNLTVRENLLEQIPRWERGNDISAAIDAFPILGTRLRQVAGTMSGGQQQMVALARCYLSKPKVVLLDELSMGLAPIVVDQIFESINGLAQGGTSLLIVEQYVDRVLALASTAYLLNHGEVAFAGPAAELKRDALMRDYLGAGVSGT